MKMNRLYCLAFRCRYDFHTCYYENDRSKFETIFRRSGLCRYLARMILSKRSQISKHKVELKICVPFKIDIFFKLWHADERLQINEPVNPRIDILLTPKLLPIFVRLRRLKLKA